jgi:hypothetical protein
MTAFQRPEMTPSVRSTGEPGSHSGLAEALHYLLEIGGSLDWKLPRPVCPPLGGMIARKVRDRPGSLIG